MDRRTDATLLDDYSMETRGPMLRAGVALVEGLRFVGTASDWCAGAIDQSGGHDKGSRLLAWKGSMMGRHGGQHGQVRTSTTGREGLAWIWAGA
ncbi:hypothetical protein BN1723_010660 [Verticillium longisporum]|uniref:Uncharacterized protein n=1 Tax=Verticillium longisporum TaxID=100787 RepID=A0A0G4L0E8_VERLO|nr:hypothetical protein BN1723_010660 [Verticillium longisporum]